MEDKDVVARTTDIPTEEDSKILAELGPKEPEAPAEIPPAPKEEIKPEVKPEEKPEEPPKVEEEEEELPKRPLRAIPIPKYQAEKSKWREREQELEATITELNEKLETIAPKETSAEIKKLAEEYGVDENFIRKLADLTVKKSQIPRQYLKSLEETYQEKQFDKEFSQVATEFPEINSSEIKAKLHDLATGYSEEVPLRTLVIEFKHDNPDLFKPKQKTIESGTPGASQIKELTDFDSVTPQDIAKMTPQQVDEYGRYMEEKEKRENPL